MKLFYMVPISQVVSFIAHNNDETKTMFHIVADRPDLADPTIPDTTRVLVCLDPHSDSEIDLFEVCLQVDPLPNPYGPRASAPCDKDYIDDLMKSKVLGVNHGDCMVDVVTKAGKIHPFMRLRF